MEHSFFVKARPILIGIFAFIFLLTAAFAIWVKSTGALLGFGGRITSVIPCTCGPVPLSTAVTVVGPSPGIFLNIVGVSSLFSHYQIYRPGPFVVGGWAPSGAICMIGLPPDCVPVLTPPIGTIISVGTSL